MGAYGAFPPYGAFSMPNMGNMGNMPSMSGNPAGMPAGMYIPPSQTNPMSSMPMTMGSMPTPNLGTFGQPGPMPGVVKKKATKKKAATTPKKPKKKVAKKKPAKKTPKPKLTKSGKKKKERDPLAPKRARTAFNFFLDAFREEFKITHPDVKGVVHCTKAGSEKWKTLTPAERSPYEEKAAAAREAYLKAKEAYVSSGGPQKFKLAKGPPRPPTAYFVFLANFRKDRAASGAEPTSIKDISKLAGQKWRELDPSDKIPYEQKAALAKQEYLKLKGLTAEERVAAVGIKNPYAQFL